MITTTLQQLKDAEACVPRYTHLRNELGLKFGMKTELSLIKIFETNGREDVLWALENAVQGGDKILRLWAADCAAHVLHFFTLKYPDDKRPEEAIKAVRQYAVGEISNAQLTAARAAAARAAGDAARAAGDAAWAARAAAARAAGDAAARAARAAGDAARAAGDAAARAAGDAAWAAAARAAGDAAWAAEDKWQTELLIKYLKEEK